MVPPELQRPAPPYLQITQHYRNLIRSGQLRDGDRLPSTRQIVREWGVAHATAARVLSTLGAEGLVTSVPGGGGGTVVNVREQGHSPRDRMLSVRRWGRIYPEGERARVVSAELVDAPEHVAEALGAEVGARVIRRHRITFRGDTPVSASTSWFPGELAEVAPALLSAERIVQGTPAYVEERTGRTAKHGTDQLAATQADDLAASELRLPAGSPVLIGRNRLRDSAGHVIEYGEYVSVPDAWSTYEYELG